MGLLVSKNDFVAAQALLDDEALWLETDVSKLLGEEDASPIERKFGWLVAKTLQENGADAEASLVLRALLREQNGYDPAYALLLKIEGEQAIEYFDTLFAIDQFEERPLIWKAQHLINTGLIEEAEKIATQAITIDPSDGEQPKNDRMRVYDIMQQIRSAQGKEDEAIFFANVLTAIRHSENADDYYSAGLYTESIERYTRSLEFFEDAYCIQSRLAVRLYDQGHVDDAIKHYKKAYELMPSSFGRVESHCFGCESAFAGEQPQSIAEEVFLGLMKTQPDSPQLYYLMGYLRDYQDREVEALGYLKKAVELDPDYLNAWKKIHSLSQQMDIGATASDDLALKIYALDPLGQHSSPQLDQVKSIKRMWNAVLQNKATLTLIPKLETVYPLTAAANIIKPQPADNYRFNYTRVVEHPVDALEQNDVIEAIENLFIKLSHGN
jgi:tetratricopeptide (TPR) repeat protein